MTRTSGAIQGSCLRPSVGILALGCGLISLNAAAQTEPPAATNGSEEPAPAEPGSAAESSPPSVESTEGTAETEDAKAEGEENAESQEAQEDSPRGSGQGAQTTGAGGASSARDPDSTSTDSQKKKGSPFIDPKDGWVDASEWLEKVYGFVPVPTIITEPALGGFGAALGLAFFGKRKKDQHIPPNIAFLGGGYTANESWFVGGGYRGYWDEGRWRGSAYGFYAAPNLSFYAELPTGTEVSALADMQAFGGGGRLLRKVGELPLYLGVSASDKQVGLSLDGLDFAQEIGLPELELNQNILVLNAAAELDTRNNVFSPTEGSYVHVEGGYNGVFGDREEAFGNVSIAAHQFFDLRRVVLGFRAVTSFVIGGAPFYLRPYVSLRGVPIARYQGTVAFALENEEMIRLTDRIGMVVFGGYGKAVSDQVSFSEATNVWSVGAGFRYLLARVFGLQMGFDVARGPEDFAWYIQFGHAWNRD